MGVNESLIIDLELLCGCDCEIPGHPVCFTPKSHKISISASFPRVMKKIQYSAVKTVSTSVASANACRVFMAATANVTMLNRAPNSKGADLITLLRSTVPAGAAVCAVNASAIHEAI